MPCPLPLHFGPLTPVYVDSDAVIVKVHDLPATVSHNTVHEHMVKYGKVISISGTLLSGDSERGTSSTYEL